MDELTGGIQDSGIQQSGIQQSGIQQSEAVLGLTLTDSISLF